MSPLIFQFSDDSATYQSFYPTLNEGCSPPYNFFEKEWQFDFFFILNSKGLVLKTPSNSSLVILEPSFKWRFYLNIPSWYHETFLLVQCGRALFLGYFLFTFLKNWLSFVKYKNRAGAWLGISIKRFTLLHWSYFISNFNGSLAHAREIHGFTSKGSGNPRVHRNPWNPS